MKLAYVALASVLALSACDDGGASYSGGGLNRVMTITNDYSSTMVRFYASNTGQNSWGPDQLGSSVLPSGSFMTIDFDDGTGACHFDFQAQFSNGETLEASDVNVCVESNWSYF